MSKRYHHVISSDSEDKDNESNEENEETNSNDSLRDNNNDNVTSCSSASDNRTKIRKNIYDKFFTFRREEKNKVGQCNICLQNKKIIKIIKMKDFNTTGLKKHLQSCHKAVFDSEFGTKSTNKVFKGQQSIKDAFQHSKQINSNKNVLNQDTFDKMVVRWMCVKYLPFNFFDDDLTQTFFKTLNDQISYPRKDALRCRVLSEFEYMRNNLANVLQKNDSKISFTIDGWTSVANRSFYGITAHFIDKNWQLQSIVLDFVPSNGNHTGKDIAKIFYESVSFYGIQNKIQGITVDNAAANTKFMDELKILMSQNGITFDPETQHFRCFAHILNLGVQDMLKFLHINNSKSDSYDIQDEDENDENELNSQNLDGKTHCVTKLRKLFIKIKYSEQLQNKMKSCCETTNIKFLSPNVDVSTRWNSTFDMLQTGLHLKSALRILCENNENISEFTVNDDEWNIISKVTRFLKGFKLVSTKLGGDKYSTLPIVIVFFNMLLDEIEKQIYQLDGKEDRNQIDEALLLSFQKGRDKMIKHYHKTNWLYCASLIIDPRHKVETFELSQWGKEMKESSLNTFVSILKTYCDVENLMETSESTSDSTDSDDFDTTLSKYYGSNKADVWDAEFDNYKNSPRMGKDTDILLWWKVHADTYPNIAKMAKDVLGITATSVPSERLFSKASLVIRKHRNSLNWESARSLLCLNSWHTSELAEQLVIPSTSRNQESN